MMDAESTALTAGMEARRAFEAWCRSRSELDAAKIAESTACEAFVHTRMPRLTYQWHRDRMAEALGVEEMAWDTYLAAAKDAAQVQWTCPERGATVRPVMGRTVDDPSRDYLRDEDRAARADLR